MIRFEEEVWFGVYMRSKADDLEVAGGNEESKTTS